MGVAPESTCYMSRAVLGHWNHTPLIRARATLFRAMSASVEKFLVGPPAAAAVEPGNCQFNEEWLQVPLVSKASVRDTRLFTFSLPDTSKPLGLSTCACLLARGGKDKEGNPFVRPYTPISTNASTGKMELMVKVYEQGNLSKAMDALKIGDTLEFKHIDKNVKIQYPFQKKHIGCLVGGTGVSPILQALHSILGTSTDKTKVSILYGSRTADDILLREVLDDWCAAHGDQLDVTHVLSEEPKDTQWTGARGFINKDLVEKHFPKPNDEDSLIFICGPPPMYKALTGPRDEPEVTGLLGDMGYKQEHVFKF